jgi:hypothetical protein
MFINCYWVLNGESWQSNVLLSLKFVGMVFCLFGDTIWPVTLESYYSFSFPFQFPEMCGFQSDLFIYMRYPFLCVSGVVVRQNIERLLRLLLPSVQTLYVHTPLYCLIVLTISL